MKFMNFEPDRARQASNNRCTTWFTAFAMLSQQRRIAVGTSCDLPLDRPGSHTHATPCSQLARTGKRTGGARGKHIRDMARRAGAGACVPESGTRLPPLQLGTAGHQPTETHRRRQGPPLHRQLLSRCVQFDSRCVLQTKGKAAAALWMPSLSNSTGLLHVLSPQSTESITNHVPGEASAVPGPETWFDVKLRGWRPQSAKG